VTVDKKVESMASWKIRRNRSRKQQWLYRRIGRRLGWRVGFEVGLTEGCVLGIKVGLKSSRFNRLKH
jgi:hypothetical protein